MVCGKIKGSSLGQILQRAVSQGKENGVYLTDMIWKYRQVLWNELCPTLKFIC